jgi:predicted lipid-binding transport protein (Tim44 family)
MNIDPFTVFFAVLAIFVAWRLWSVLGTSAGAPPAAAPMRSPVAPLPAAPPAADRWRGVAEAGGPLARGLDAVVAGDPGFEPKSFLSGARSAYEMITAAFAAGDLDSLRPLLGPETFADFSRAIEARRAAGRRMTTTLVAIDGADLVEAAAQDGVARVAVKFRAKMTSATLDSSGAVVEGSPSEIAEHVEIWTFARPFGAHDPNWRLIATQPEN